MVSVQTKEHDTVYIKRKLSLVVLVTIMLSLTACSFDKDNIANKVENAHNISSTNLKETEPDNKTATIDGEKEERNQMNIQVGDYSFTATLADNISAGALKEYLADGPVTLYLEDYAGIEKVGDLGISLPRDDKQISTSAGDIILYQGRNIVIYYGTNSWNLTRLGKIDNTSADELKEAFGSGNVEVTLSLQ